MLSLSIISSVTAAYVSCPMTNPATQHRRPARRSSSVAFDRQFDCTTWADPKYLFNGGDSWRKRWNLPPFQASSSSLSSVRSSTQDALHDNSNPIFSFGILTDIQYAPIPDGYSHNGTPRYYRHALTVAEYAAKHFELEKVQCVVNLGDIIDGKCASVEKYGGIIDTDSMEEKKTDIINRSVGNQALDEVLKALSSFKSGTILHAYGNHELYNLSRNDLRHKLNIPFTVEPSGDLVGYYCHIVDSHMHIEKPKLNIQTAKLRLLVLDSYDICLLDRCPQTSPKCRLARQILAARNPNYPHDENSPEGLEGLHRRFVAFNGGIDIPQLEWLENSLQTASENGERVIVFSHQPIHPESSWPTCIMWNYLDVLKIMRKYSNVIIASFSGHAHKGGYVRDEESGIHFRTMEAVLESPDPVRTYGIVDVWHDRMVVKGSGDCVSDVYDLDHLKFEKHNIAAESFAKE